MTADGSNEHDVVAALLRRAGRVLLCHRSPHRQWYPNCWDLPGGHVEQNERPQHALTRELREELGVVVTTGRDPFAYAQGRDFRMDVWLFDTWSGAPTNLVREHDKLAWVDLVAAGELRLADPQLLQLLEAALG